MNRISATCVSRLVAAVTAGVLGAPLGWSGVEAADELQVSADGVHWAPEYPGSLFAGGTILAPGDTADAVVYVRNASADDATMSLATTGVTDHAGSQHVHLDVSIRVGDASTSAVSRSVAELAIAGDGAVLAGELSSGQVARIDIGIRLDAAAPNSTQRLLLDFGLEVWLRGDILPLPAVPRPPVSDAPADRGGGWSLPGTGAVAAYPVLIAAVAFAAGVAVHRLGRRRRIT